MVMIVNIYLLKNDLRIKAQCGQENQLYYLVSNY